MPDIFFPPSSRSLGHFMSGETPQTSSMAAQAARAPAQLSREAFSGGNSGRHSMERYSPPGGEEKLRPSLPRPPVCLKAATTVP